MKKTIVILKKNAENILFCQTNKVLFIENKKPFLTIFLATFPSPFLSPDPPKVNKYFECIMWMLLPRIHQGLCFRGMWL